MPDAPRERTAYELETKWHTVLGLMAVQIQNQLDFNTYVADLAAESLTGDVLRVAVRSGFIAAWIQKRVMGSMVRIASEVFGRSIKIELVPPDYVNGEELERLGLTGDHRKWAATHLRMHRDNLATENRRLYPTNPALTFDRFASSECNAEALGASKRVVETPGQDFNPLTVIGETGQGKTHLLNAIAIELRQANLNVIYLTGEEFLDSYVKSSAEQKVRPLRDRYREADAIVVDGIEKLLPRKSTQAFFVAMMEHMLANRKQVVVSVNSAHPVNEFTDDLASRLAGGLEVAISPPDLELKRSILEHYSLERRLSLANEALDFLAKRAARNVREIIGGIARVDAHTRLSAQPSVAQSASIDLPTVQEAVKDRLITTSPQLAAPDVVIRAVADALGLDAAALRRRGRDSQSVSLARDVAIYMLRDKSGLTSSETGVILGGRSHSTIRAALRRYSARRVADADLREAERRAERLLR